MHCVRILSRNRSVQQQQAVQSECVDVRCIGVAECDEEDEAKLALALAVSLTTSMVSEKVYEHRAPNRNRYRYLLS